jgi:hypothetical protein
MTLMRAKYPGKFAVAVTIAACISALAIAQEADQQTDGDEEEEAIEEIVVYGGGRPDDPVDVDALYEDMMREMLMTDMERLQVLEEEQEWRNSDERTTTDTGRIKWGYSPQDDLRFNRQSELSDVQFITTKPATVFSFEF